MEKEMRVNNKVDVIVASYLILSALILGSFYWMVPPSTLVIGMPLGTLIWGTGSLAVILYLTKTKALTKNCIGSVLVIFLGPVAMITIVIMHLTKYFYQKKYGPNTVPKWLEAKR